MFIKKTFKNRNSGLGVFVLIMQKILEQLIYRAPTDDYFSC